MAFRVFEHTADIGLEVEAPDRSVLFAEAARGLFHIVRGEADVSGTESRDVDVSADRLDRALVDFLEEFLYLQDAEGLVFADVDAVRVTTEEGSIRARARVRGEPFSRARHPGCVHVKAVTWHGLEVRDAHGPEPARARLILDI